MLPVANTISNNVEQLFTQICSTITAELQLTTKISATTDVWTDQFNQISYLSGTVHYILNDRLVKRFLAIREFDSPHTGKNIFSVTIRNL